MIQKACKQDLSRIAEIYIFNNRMNFYPIFKDINYSFDYLQVTNYIDDYLLKENSLDRTYIYKDEEIIKGFIEISGKEIIKLYVDVFFQNNGIGSELINFAIDNYGGNYLWALEKNSKAIKFYNRHNFFYNGEKKFEEGTEEYIIKLVNENI